MSGYDNEARRQLNREYAQLLASEMRRVRGPAPAEEVDQVGRSGKASQLLAHVRLPRRRTALRAPVFRG
jgi:hypothetical protein